MAVAAPGNRARRLAVIRLSPYAITALCCSARSLQFLSALATLSTVSASFKSGDVGGKDYRLGSHEASLVLLASYSVLCYAGWYLVCIEVLPSLPRPTADVSRAADAAVALLSLCAGVALMASEYVQSCGSYGPMLNCSNLRASAVLAMATALPLAASIAIATFVTPTLDHELLVGEFVAPQQENEWGGARPVPPSSSSYYLSSTPRHAIVLSSEESSSSGSGALVCTANTV